MQSVTLIIDKRLELSTKYKKLLSFDSNMVIVSGDLLGAMKIIKDKEPDLIIISDSFDSELSDFCKQVRALTYEMRPVIVALSKSADFNDRINVLNSGADDFLSEPVNPEEFKVRMKAHLRREFESNFDSKLILPNKNYTLRAIKRKLDKSDWAILYIRIDNFSSYKEAYTELASDKLLQTYSAIIKATVDENDYVGQLEEDVFIVITNTLKSERIARFLTMAFESVACKFYAEHDLSRGYMILQGDEFAGKRSDFVHSTIGVVTNEVGEYQDSMQVLNSLTQICDMAKLPNRSNYLVERAKIVGEGSIQERFYNNRVLIFEADEALRLLLNTILDLQGYKTQAIETFEIPEMDVVPALIIIDAGDLEKKNGLNLCYKIKQSPEFKDTKVIVTSVIHDKELVLNTGADLYLPKPYEISNLIRWVDNLVKEFNG
ncbi:diguanylate cyclase [bacterium]|nr:diguanylate cyclase [bacterium]